MKLKDPLNAPDSPDRREPKKATRRLSPALLPIFLIVLVDVFGFTLVIPLLTIYAESSRFRATPLEATLLVFDLRALPARRPVRPSVACRTRWAASPSSF